MRKIEEILKLVCSFLSENNMEYVIVGGIAVLFYGTPRTTMDIDYVVQLADKDIPAFVEFLQENGFYADEYDMRTALKEKSHCTPEDKETMFRLDIKGVYTEMDERVLMNKKKIKINDIVIYIASPEDTIANKLLFSREQDLNDVLGIYARQRESLNMEYLKNTCKKIGVYDALLDLIKRYEKYEEKNNMGTLKPINVGHLSTVYHTSFILMGTDWLEKAGIHANWKLFASGPDIVSAFANEEIDIGYLGLPPAIIGIDRGVSIICVAGGHVEGTVLIAQKEYSTLDELEERNSVLAQFEGKVISSPPKGSIHDVIINNALQEAKLNISVKNFAWTDFVLEALADGEIEAAVGTPSLAVAAARACGAKIVIPPHALWQNNPSYGIVIRKELMQHPDVILRFLEMHEKASNFIRANPVEAARLVSKLTGIMDESFVLEAYGISPKYCASLSPEFVASTMAFVPVLHRLKYILREIPESEIFEYSFIKKVHKEPPHYNQPL